MKKPSLKSALRKVDNLAESFFGNVSVDLSSLPCLTKVTKEKITANFDSDVLEAVRAAADEYEVSYSSLINDVLRKVFIDEKKGS
ncbi:MAG: BrnA antitoxin family protein [Bacteriovoracaceae bacterium]|nr:BrnA antitoxin family protein [Bacteriovoracaceae bacterium]